MVIEDSSLSNDERGQIISERISAKKKARLASKESASAMSSALDMLRKAMSMQDEEPIRKQLEKMIQDVEILMPIVMAENTSGAGQVSPSETMAPMGRI